MREDFIKVAIKESFMTHSQSKSINMRKKPSTLGVKPFQSSAEVTKTSSALAMNTSNRA